MVFLWSNQRRCIEISVSSAMQFNSSNVSCDRGQVLAPSDIFDELPPNLRLEVFEEVTSAVAGLD